MLGVNSDGGCSCLFMSTCIQNIVGMILLPCFVHVLWVWFCLIFHSRDYLALLFLRGVLYFFLKSFMWLPSSLIMKRWKHTYWFLFYLPLSSNRFMPHWHVPLRRPSWITSLLRYAKHSICLVARALCVCLSAMVSVLLRLKGVRSLALPRAVLSILTSSKYWSLV